MHLLAQLAADAPFSQWADMEGGDIIYLIPYVLIIWLLVPKSGSSSKKTASSSSGGMSPILMIGVFAVVIGYLMNTGAIG